MNNLINFDGYKFRQSMQSTMESSNGVNEVYGENYELQKENRLTLAENDCQRMWRHLWNKISSISSKRTKGK